MDNIFEKLENIQKSVDELKRTQTNIPTGKVKSEQEIFTDFIKSSCKEYVHMSSTADFEKDKKITTIILFAYIAISVIITILCSIGFKIYSTFTLFENIWLVCSCFMLYYTVIAPKFYNTEVFANKSIDVFEFTKENIWINTNIRKKRYKAFFVLSIICAGLNLIASFCIPNANIGLIIVCELVYIAATIISYIYFNNFFAQYNSLKFTGKDLSGKKTVSIYFDNIFGKYLTEEEYYKTYPWVKQ